MKGIGAVYGEGRARLTELVRTQDPDGRTGPIPCCPEWTVHDVVAHVTGVCADVLAGNIEGVATEPWTAVQVATRKDTPLPEILTEWAEVAPQVEAMAEYFPMRTDEQWVLDLTTHEQDIRGALGVSGARDSAGVVVGVDFATTMGMAASIEGRGLPALRIKAGDREWVVGDGDPAASVEGTLFDLFRALTGRRSADQIRALDWDGDVDVFVPAFEFGPFTLPLSDIEE